MTELTEVEERAFDEATKAKHALYEGMQALREVVGGLRRSENPEPGEPTFKEIEQVDSGLNECMHCGEPLEFKPGRGWVHQEGGAYKMACAKCGWTGAPYPSPGKCPQCGSTKDLRDDHCALPKRS